MNKKQMKLEWVLDIKDQCIEAEVPFFFKQWGGKKKKKAGRLLEGRTWDELPILKIGKILFYSIIRI